MTYAVAGKPCVERTGRPALTIVAKLSSNVIDTTPCGYVGGSATSAMPLTCTRTGVPVALSITRSWMSVIAARFGVPTTLTFVGDHDIVSATQSPLVVQRWPCVE